MENTVITLPEVLLYLDAERKRRRLTYQQIADATGWTDASTVRRFLASENPTLQTVTKLATAMGLNLTFGIGDRPDPVRITMYNHAGGTGKTSLARDIGVRMGQLGLKVLLIDLDPQANLTDWLQVDSSELSLDDTVYPALIPTGGQPNGQLKPLPTPVKTPFGVDLIPSYFDLVVLDPHLYAHAGTGPIRMRKALTTLEQSNDYDIVIIDPPPYISNVSNLAALTADQVVVPVSTDAKSVEGLGRVRLIVEGLKEQHPTLKIAAIVPTNFNGQLNPHKDAMEALPAYAEGIPILTPLAQRNSPYGQAQAHRIPIPAGTDSAWRDAQKDVDHVTGELLELLGVQVSVDQQ